MVRIEALRRYRRLAIALGSMGLGCLVGGIAGLAVTARWPAVTARLAPIIAQSNRIALWQRPLEAFQQRQIDAAGPGMVWLIGDSLMQAIPPFLIHPCAINLGVGGAGAADIARRLEGLAADPRPAATIVAVGINDLLRGRPPEEVTTILSGIIRSSPGRIIIAGLMPMKDGSSHTNVEIADLNEMLARICTDTCLYIGPPPEIHDGQVYHLEDGLHLNALGTGLWASHLAAAVDDIPARCIRHPKASLR